MNPPRQDDENENTVTGGDDSVNARDEATRILETMPGKSPGVEIEEGGVSDQTAASVQPPLNAGPAPSNETPEQKKARKKAEYNENRRKKYAEKTRNAPPPPRGPARETVANPQQPPVVQTLPPEAVADIINQTYGNLVVGFLGEEAAITPSEKQTLDASLVAYLRTKNYDLPPGLALAFAYSSITVAKLRKPKPRERLAAVLTFVRSKLGRKKGGDNVAA